MTETFIALAMGVAVLSGYLWWRHRPEPSGWFAGPRIRGTNYSPGIKLGEMPGLVWVLTVGRGSELDGVTKARGALMRGIRLRYRVTGTGLYASEAHDAEPILTLYTARAGNRWSLKGDDRWNRWYTTAPLPLTPGDHSFDVPFDPAGWHCVTGAPAIDFPNQFAAALADRGRVGLGFGYWGGRMHGVASAAPVTFELIEWDAA